MLISPFEAAVLGVVEGLTEFLPVSSTGHLILATVAMGMDWTDEGVKAFTIVIQAGALLAVVAHYREHVLAMIRGLLGLLRGGMHGPESAADRAGLRLLTQLVVAFLPAMVVGLLANDFIKEKLFGPWPVIAALAAGGVAMIAVEWWRGARARSGDAPHVARELNEMTVLAAFIIGCCQCLAMWPGTSRSMGTIVSALLLGFSPRAAAEFSFLLALPTLGAATVHDGYSDGGALLEASGWPGLIVGFIVSMVVAWLAVKGFLAWLKQHGLVPFGVYRLLLALVFMIFML